ncbi:uncharacterized protein VICG_02068 [Vittaforma corneae ATCC 50505]|uniref:Dolichyl-phosphate-mannose--protein mannosyltransferase n=1 Tax=Vittaforma corneae (strain ATCC 50505) TaxID=993615 RepID=L2GJ26_VITCO|nr:uncharacterized protein VICG_02068 [Vittaforma corneae ATCC 50505]ELA40888.1 hypothetical protein VICG_02068 [Vittaforma corneae ATCC 50505]
MPKLIFSWTFPLFVFLLSYLVKIHRIEKGNFVTWDEAHFGKFAQKYLERTFYFDVHPPLGKMLTALSGLIHGQSNDFDFGSKENYPITFDYAGMRRFHAFIASFTPLFAYLILREFNFSLRRSLLLTLLFIFENGVVSISRLILLDSHLLTFTAGTIYFLVRLFQKIKKISIIGKKDCNIQLLLLGLFIGCVMSVKWIGFFTTLQVGSYIAVDLYFKLMFMSPLDFLNYFSRRVVYLILFPIVIYIFLFYIHFSIVNTSGSDDGFMSSEFQLSLKDSVFSKVKKYVSYGKKITVKTPHGYLHSHLHTYPDVSTDLSADLSDLHVPLQVTIYNHKDRNNNFYFQKVTDGDNADVVMNGDSIVLLHAETNGYVEQSKREAYFTPGFRINLNRAGIEQNAVWIVEIESDTVKKEELVKSISTKFYLKNSISGMYLCSTTKTYPHWGYDQGEIVSQAEKAPNCLFNVEENFFSDSPGNEEYKEVRPSFLRRCIEHQIAMFNTNKSFTQDPDLEPERIVSKPYEWPILRRGLRMSQWHEQYKFYMFMNPFILYSTTIGILISPIMIAIKHIKNQRKKATYHTNNRLCDENNASQNIKEIISDELNNKKLKCDSRVLKDNVNEEKSKKIQFINTKDKSNCHNHKKSKTNKLSIRNDWFFLYISLGGWVIHYLPFFLIGRVLYLHHYFPALFFATLNLCYILRTVPFKICMLFVSISIIFFILYSPLTYGFISEDSMRYLKIFSEWDFAD